MTPGSLSVITKDLVTDVVLLDEVTEQLLISTGPICDLFRWE